MKVKLVVFILVIFLLVFIQYSFSATYQDFTTPRTCSQIFGNCNSTTTNDALLGCNGTQKSSNEHVEEVYLNASAVHPNDPINVTCQFFEKDRSGSYEVSEYLWYYNGTNWTIIYSNWTDFAELSGGSISRNRSFVFNVNSTEGMHIVRCNINLRYNTSDYCNNQTATEYDTDDVNFTVVIPLSYDYWNITFTNGTVVINGTILTRSDTVIVAAHWNKSINYSAAEINGTRIFNNYTISDFIGNWTNYTINLSNTTLYNQTNITINAIYANDSVGTWGFNKTSPVLYFYLSAGNPPNVTNFWFNYSNIRTNQTNKYTNLTIYANVSDDVGLNNVVANITYPDGNSTNVTMSGSSCYLPNWCIWNYTFGNDLHLNSTGNYTVRIIAYDIGNQNKSSGTDNGSENMNFTVYENYTLNLTSNYSIYMRGENVTVQAIDVNNYTVETIDWIANITKINQVYNFTPQATTFNYTILPDDIEGNYSIIVNASKNNNTGNSSWNFNVSRTLSLAISTTPASSPPKNTLVNVSLTLTNARGETYTSSVNANITCVNTMYPLSFSSGQASYLCTSPDSYSTSFNITVNISDQYNNTGENYKTLTTEAAPSTGGGSGGGGGGFATTKNCSDGTLYSKCSSNRPLFCKNGVLIENCSECKCESGYDCQIDGSCKVSITILENFSFSLNVESIEIEKGENSSIIASLSNTGNTPLDLTATTESDCCNVSIEENFSLNENEVRNIPISIHVPLFMKNGEHLLKIKIGKEYFKKEETIKVIVLECPHNTAIREFEAFLNTLENEIIAYKRAGIDVRSLEAVIEESRKMILNASSSIEKDDLEVLKDSISGLRQNINSITSTMLLLKTQKFLLENKFLIALVLIMAIITTYLVPEVFIPLYKLEKNIRKLKTDEKDLVSSRVETEKQYFMRKLDENTFSKIMITKQDQILKLKATIEEREKGRKDILLRMHPKEMIKWFGKSIKNLPKNVKNLILRAIEKIKSKKIVLFKMKPKMTV